MPRIPKLPQDLERAARRAPLVGRLLPAAPPPRRPARPPARRAAPPAAGQGGDLLGALDAARDRLRTAIPPRPDDE